jgi:V/A-type H+/Na+-transporting ATPase subunit C
LIRTGFNPPSHIYTCTRFRVRKTTLLAPDEYLRLLNMSLPGIINTLSNRGYGREILEISMKPGSVDLLETALSRNLIAAFHHALAITQDPIRTLVIRYLNRWDIANVMAILRGKQQGILDQQVRDILIPAGELDAQFLANLIRLPACNDVTSALIVRDKTLYSILEETYRTCGQKRVLAHVENALYKNYYRNLIADAESGISGGDLFLKYLRREIDITNLRNLFRLRNYEKEGSVIDFTEYMIPGGRLPLDLIRLMYRTEDQGIFVETFKKTGILSTLTHALRNLRSDPAFSESDAAAYVWDRWRQRKAVIHEVEIAVTHVLSDELDRLSKRYPFSVLPVISFLEEKRYEIANLRAISRGKAAKMPVERIRRYLIL